MTQKAVVYETRAQKIVNQDKDLQRLYALNRSRITVKQTNISPGGSTPSSAGSSGGQGNFLATEGDTMIGPIGFNQVLVVISDGRIAISETSRTTPDSQLTYSSYVAMTGQGTPDDLNWIDGAGFNGQLLFLQGTPSQIINVINSIYPTISNITGTGTVTVTTSADHGLVTGQQVNILTTTNFNVNGVTITVTGATTFTYSDAGDSTPETSGDVQDGNIIVSDGIDVVLDGTLTPFSRQGVILIFDQLFPHGGAWSVYSRPDSSGGTSFIGFQADADLDMNDFDVNTVDRIIFMQNGNTMIGTDVGFDAPNTGDLLANFLTGKKFYVTEENVTKFAVNGNSNFVELTDMGLSILETIGSTQFSIIKFNGRTEINEPTKIEFLIGNTLQFDLTDGFMTFDDNNGILVNVDQIGFRNLGNIIQDDVNGMIFSTPPGDDFNWDDGTDIFATLDKDLFALQFASIMVPKITIPADPPSDLFGKIVYNTADNRLSFRRRNDADTAYETIDLEAGGSISFIGFMADADLDMNDFDVNTVDRIIFMQNGNSFLSTDVGFDAPNTGDLGANILANKKFYVTEANIQKFAIDTNTNFVNLTDMGLSLLETSGSTQFSIIKFNGRTEINEPTSIRVNIGGVEQYTLTDGQLTFDDNNGIIANVDQIGFRNLGNIIEDDASGMRYLCVPTDQHLWGDGTDIFATLDFEGLFLNQLFIQFTSIASPGATGSTNVGELFMDSGNSDHLSIIRNGSPIDLESGGVPLNSVGLPELVHQTDGSLFTFSTSTVPILLTPGTDGQKLTAHGSGSQLTWEDSPIDPKITSTTEDDGEFPDAEVWYSARIHGTKRLLDSGSQAEQWPSSSPGVDVVFWIPFLVEHEMTVNSLGIFVFAAVGSTTWRGAIYNSNAELEPTTIVMQTPSASQVASGNNTTTIGNNTLNPGLYFLAYKQETSAVPGSFRIKGIEAEAITNVLGTEAQDGGTGQDLGDGAICGYFADYTTAGMPTNFSSASAQTKLDSAVLTLTDGSSGAPEVFYRVVSVP